MFDYVQEQSNVKEDGLFLLILGASGQGKSHLMGTYPGPILYLYTSNEYHGVASAKKSNSNVVSVCVDRSATGEILGPDQAWARLFAALKPDAVSKAGFKAIAVDGLTELEKIARGTKVWKNQCQNAQGKHNNFAEPAATVGMLDALLAALRQLQEVCGVDILVTGILDITALEDNGAIAEAKPRLSGYSVAESMCQAFPDIITIGRMKSKTGAGTVIQMISEVGRESKDASGAIKKTFGFTPRLMGVKTVPDFIKADLKEILTLKGRTK